MKRTIAIVLALCALTVGCSTSNTPEDSPHSHGKTWVAQGPNFHGVKYRDGSLDCRDCHSIDSYCERCHFAPTQDDVRVPPGSEWVHPNPATDPLGLSHRGFVAFEETCNTCHRVARSYGEGPAPCHDCHGSSTAGHPLPFTDPALHGALAKQDLTFCLRCHAELGVDNPRFDLPVGDLAQGCETCHNDRTAHPSSGGRDGHHWYGVYNHAGADKLTEACTLCHGAVLDGVGGVGPSCLVCHTISPLTALNCASCHGKPPNGSSSPNRAGSHSAHDSLAEVGGICGTCHSGAGARAQKHFDGEVDVALLGDFDAKSGTASFDGNTCSNVSCHGGQPTPDWFEGSVVVESDCKKCHTLGTTQYNSYHSGLHELHTVALSLFCTNCHNTTKLANTHFTNLKTPIIEGVPSSTLGGGTTHVAAYSAGSCTPTDAEGCHGTKTWGAPHPTDGSFTAPSLHGAAAKAQEFTYCQECHASPGFGSNPRFDVVIGRLTAGCETCHNARTAHPSGGGQDQTRWYGTYHHDEAQNPSVACALCHGAALDGVGGTGGPSCRTCHVAGSPLLALNCTSCHSSPPSGSAQPNRTGGHGAHNVLAKVTGACGTCHSGAGNRTALHKNGAIDVSLSSGYAAKSGSATYNAVSHTCSNVRCHGGLATPNWLTQTLNVNASCTSCHSYGTGQYNSFSSGRHRTHVNEEGIGCTGCHNTSTLAINHFTNLDTIALEGPASATIGGGATRVNSYSNQTCNAQCHSVETW